VWGSKGLCTECVGTNVRDQVSSARVSHLEKHMTLPSKGNLTGLLASGIILSLPLVLCGVVIQIVPQIGALIGIIVGAIAYKYAMRFLASGPMPFNAATVKAMLACAVIAFILLLTLLIISFLPWIGDAYSLYVTVLCLYWFGVGFEFVFWIIFIIVCAQMLAVRKQPTDQAIAMQSSDAMQQPSDAIKPVV